MTCGHRWRVDGHEVECIRHPHSDETRHMARHPTEVGEHVFLPAEREPKEVARD